MSSPSGSGIPPKRPKKVPSPVQIVEDPAAAKPQPSDVGSSSILARKEDLLSSISMMTPSPTPTTKCGACFRDLYSFGGKSPINDPEYPPLMSLPRELPLRPLLNELKLLGQPEVTHADSMLIRNVQCFLVATAKVRQRAEQSALLEGIYVTYRGICSQENCKKCSICDVCVHLYVCSCQTEPRQWCPHIHVMHQLTRGVYRKNAMLFVHENCKWTETRHLRAFIEGKIELMESDGTKKGKIPRSDLVYEVQRSDTTERCICRADQRCDLCTACYCKYVCTCDDYARDHMVCQHVHNLAMQEDESGALFQQFTGFGRKLEVSEGEDPSLSYYISEEHTMSLYMIDDRIRLVDKPPSEPAEWFITSSWEPPEVTVRERGDVYRKCYCKKPQANKTNSCSSCGICQMHYICSCPTSKFTICRHMHAVGRRVARDKIEMLRRADFLRMESQPREKEDPKVPIRILKTVKSFLPVTDTTNIDTVLDEAISNLKRFSIKK